jgi:hypothetical protein
MMTMMMMMIIMEFIKLQSVELSNGSCSCGKIMSVSPHNDSGVNKVVDNLPLYCVQRSVETSYFALPRVF